MKISFTGTRRGMTENQRKSIECWLLIHEKDVAMASHGCCIGADIQFHCLLREVFGSRILIAVFPSTAKTAAPIPKDADYVAPPRPPLVRDKDIMNNGRDFLLVAPYTSEEVLRSGTWATKRYAEKIKVPFEVFNPC